MVDTWQPDRAIANLHPIMRIPVGQLISSLPRGPAGNFQLYEGYRSPSRQAHLYAQGRTRQGEIVTKAQAWEGAHNYGLAVDFVWRDSDGNWSWAEDRPWGALHRAAEAVGLVAPIKWDRPHLEHPEFQVLKARLRG